MFTDQDVEIVAGRLAVWATVLGGLADPTACRNLLSVLDQGNGKAFHELLDGWGLPDAGCIEIVERSEERRVGKECRSRWSPYH